MLCAIDYFSCRISCKLFVPNILRSVVAASNRVAFPAFETFVTDKTALNKHDNSKLRPHQLLLNL